MNTTRVYAINYGDIFYTTDVDKDVKPGEQYKNYPGIIWKIFYKKRPWYLFWKKKEIEGVNVLWLGDE